MTISKSIRRKVRERANYRCEYCLKPEGFSAHKHHVDHIIAQKHQGSDELDNLAWACFQCNVHKGSDIASYDTKNNLTPLFHPRRQSWNKHFELVDEVIKGLTSVGEVTVSLLQINSLEQLETRRLLMEEDLW